NRASFPNISDDGIAALQRAIDPTADVLRRAHARHVKIVFGTDAVAGAHGRNAEEFIYRVRDAHEPAMETLKSATSMAAESLGMSDRIGAFAAGMGAGSVQ